MKKEKDNCNLEVYLIRHGKTREARGDELVSDVREFPINEEGVRQAKDLKDRLNQEGYIFDRVYSSPIRVAQETADNVFGDNYVNDVRLTKHFHGDWEDRIRREVYTDEVKQELRADPYNWHAPNGESQKDIEQRMYGFLQDIVKENPSGGRIAVIAHGIPTISLLRKIWDVDSRKVQDLDLANTSLTKLDYDGKEWKVEYYGDDRHLNSG